MCLTSVPLHTLLVSAHAAGHTAGMRRSFWLTLILFALAAIIIVLPMVRATSVEERVSRIHEGMNRAEVIEAVGEPPGVYAQYTSYAETGLGPPDRYLAWYWDNGRLYVCFDDDGIAHHVLFDPNHNPPSTWQRLRSWLP
jgi:hypothetical protein